MIKSLALRAALLLALLLPTAAFASQSPTCSPPGAIAGSDYLDFVDDALAAIQSSNSGTEPPANTCDGLPIAGQPWLNTDDGTFSVFDGDEWVVQGVLDDSEHLWLAPIGGGATSLASGSTVDLWSVPHSYINITGTNTITAFGGVDATPGAEKTVVFAGVLTLTHNGTSLILPGAANIPTAAGDRARVVALGGGNSIVVDYTRASGKALVNPVVVGDSGSGGTPGVVPAAGVGDAALNKVLGASGAFVPGVPVGTILDFSGISAPGGFLLANGAAVSRTTYADLWGVVHTQATVTITIASPGVLTWTGHGLTPGAPISCATTGALPTGISTATTYYVIAAGITSNSFEIAATSGGSAINTTGSQSGVHTCSFAPYGSGDYSTTFNLPDLRGRVAAGRDDMGGSSANRLTAATTQGLDGDVLGKAGGEESHIQTVSELAAHNHEINLGDDDGTFGQRAAYTSRSTATTPNTSTVGGSAAFNVLQPTVIINKIIRY